MKTLFIFLLISKLALIKPDHSEDCNFVSYPITSDSPGCERHLKKIDYKNYINKPVSDLLSKINLEHKYINYVEMKPYFLAFVSFQYDENLWLDIYVEKYQFLKQLLTESEYENKYKYWQIDLFAKEIISKVRLRKKGKTIKEYPKSPELPYGK